MAEEFRADCGRDGDPTSQVVEMSDGIDWNALEKVLPFLDTVKTFYDARSDNEDRAHEGGGFPEGFSRSALRQLESHLEEIVESIPDFSTREVYEPLIPVLHNDSQSKGVES
ncbi:hypothetical protein ACLMAJ_28300 [Nocardia sp. KC 131]|uniref:hypothetical protein n=1 Tax=Nocardia arseniciresistens TaxID=3392119 RepID=UPI00398F3C16